VIEWDFIFVLGVTALTEVCDNVLLIYNVKRIVITLQYNTRHIPEVCNPHIHRSESHTSQVFNILII
jgi:hypothetical protein